MEGFLALHPPISSNISEILTTGSALADKNAALNLFEGFEYLMKGADPKLALLVQHWPFFSSEDDQNQKIKQQYEKSSAIELSKYIKIKSLSPLTFPGKIRFLFAVFAIFLSGNSYQDIS